MFQKHRFSTKYSDTVGLKLSSFGKKIIELFIKRWGPCPQTFKTALPILPLHLQIPDYAPVAVAYLVNRLDKETYFAISSI